MATASLALGCWSVSSVLWAAGPETGMALDSCPLCLPSLQPGLLSAHLTSQLSHLPRLRLSPPSALSPPTLPEDP